MEIPGNCFGVYVGCPLEQLPDLAAIIADVPRQPEYPMEREIFKLKTKLSASRRELREVRKKLRDLAAFYRTDLGALQSLRNKAEEAEQHAQLFHVRLDRGAAGRLLARVFGEREPMPVRADWERHVTRALLGLSPRERRVVHIYYGLETGEPLTYRAAGAAIGVTDERARQIIAKAMRRLRHPSRSSHLRKAFEGLHVELQ